MPRAREPRTKGNNDIIDISDKVAEVVLGSGLKEGMAFVFVVGSTAGITTCEYEPALERDLKKMFEKLERDRDIKLGFIFTIYFFDSRFYNIQPFFSANLG